MAARLDGYKKNRKKRQLLKRYKEGENVDQITEELEIPRRTAFSWINEAEKATKKGQTGPSQPASAKIPPMEKLHSKEPSQPSRKPPKTTKGHQKERKRRIHR
jgi:hypothetical protein